MPAGGAILDFVDASMVALDDLDRARDALRDAIGDRGVIEVAGVIGNFERMNRIADGTGLPLDEFSKEISAPLVDELGLREFDSAANTPV